VKLRMAHYISYSLFDSPLTTWITVVILELIHANSPNFTDGVYLLDTNQPLHGVSVSHDNHAIRRVIMNHQSNGQSPRRPFI